MTTTTFLKFLLYGNNLKLSLPLSNKNPTRSIFNQYTIINTNISPGN